MHYNSQSEASASHSAWMVSDHNSFDQSAVNCMDCIVPVMDKSLDSSDNCDGYSEDGRDSCIFDEDDRDSCIFDEDDRGDDEGLYDDDEHVNYTDYNADYNIRAQYSGQNEDVYDYPIEPHPSTIAAQLSQQLAQIVDPEISSDDDYDNDNNGDDDYDDYDGYDGYKCDCDWCNNNSI
jgi:hypothetical protein